MIRCNGRCLLALLCLPVTAWAHPSHLALAEAEWSTSRGKLEVALQVTPEDLEEALTRLAGGEERVRLESTKQVDQLTAAYLRPRFSVHAAGRPLEWTWVGKEVDAREAWLYFEIQLPEAGAVQLHCTVLMDVFPEQVNTVQLKQDGGLRTLRFSTAQPVHSLGR